MKRKMAKSIGNSLKFLNYNDNEKYFCKRSFLFNNYILQKSNLNENNKTQIDRSPHKNRTSNSTNYNSYISMIQNYNNSKQNENIKKKFAICIKNKSCEVPSSQVIVKCTNNTKLFLKKRQKININTILGNYTNSKDIKKYGIFLNECKFIKGLNKTNINNNKRCKTAKITSNDNHIFNIKNEKIKKIKKIFKNEKNEKLCAKIIKLVNNPESFLYSFYNTLKKEYYYNPENHKIDFKKRFADYKNFLSKYEEKARLQVLNLKNNRMIGQDINIKGNLF